MKGVLLTVKSVFNVTDRITIGYYDLVKIFIIVPSHRIILAVEAGLYNNIIIKCPNMKL